MFFSNGSSKQSKRVSSVSDRKLDMEAMEERRMMAGDVAVEMIGNELQIDGDSAGNAVQVSKLSNGNLEVRGLTKDGQLTQINGSYSPYTISASSVHSMDIDMGDGDDDLYLNNQGNYVGANGGMRLEGDLNIRMQGGDDFVKLQNMRVGGDVDISTDRDASGLMLIGRDYSGGDDTVEIYSSIMGDVDIDTRDGADDVKFDVFYSSTGYPGWNAVSSIDVDTGAGGDNVAMQNVFSHNAFTVRTRGGDDVIDLDQTAAASQYLYVHSGADHDEVNISNVSMYWNNQLDRYSRSSDADVLIYTGTGNDELTLRNVNVQTGNVTIGTDSGNDTVELHNVDVRDRLYAHLGSGDDTLNLTRSSAAVAELFGGSNTRFGTDALSLSFNRFGRTTSGGFERGISSGIGRR